MPTKPYRINTPLLAIIVEGFFSRLSFGLITFALPLYAHHLGLSLAEIGFLVSLNLTVALALKPAMGWMADRVGLKRSLTAAIGLRSLIALLLALAGSPWQLYAIRFAHGMSMSIRDPSVNALLAKHGGKKTIASAFAWYQTAKTVAGSFGKAVAGILLTLTVSNFSLVFLVAALLSVLPVCLVVRYVREESEVEDEAAKKDLKIRAIPHNQETQVSTNVRAARPAVLPFIGLGFLISGTAEMLHGLFPILATQYIGLSEAETGIIYMVSTLAVLISGPLFGWLADNISGKLVLMVRSSANILSSILYLVVPNFPGIAVSRVVDDMGKAAFRPAWGALMAYVSSFDKRRRAKTMGLISMGDDAGEIAGPIIAGFLWSTWGLPVALGVRVLFAIAGEIYAVVLTNSLKKRKDYRYIAKNPADQPNQIKAKLPIDWSAEEETQAGEPPILTTPSAKTQALDWKKIASGTAGLAMLAVVLIFLFGNADRKMGPGFRQLPEAGQNRVMQILPMADTLYQDDKRLDIFPLEAQAQALAAQQRYISPPGENAYDISTKLLEARKLFEQQSWREAWNKTMDILAAVPAEQRVLVLDLQSQILKSLASDADGFSQQGQYKQALESYHLLKEFDPQQNTVAGEAMVFERWGDALFDKRSYTEAIGKYQLANKPEKVRNAEAEKSKWLGIELVFVPGGSFEMGDVFGDGESDERPVHAVQLSSFYLSKYEITFEQYDRFCKEKGVKSAADNGWGRGNRPAINVVWFEANAFCAWLAERTGANVRLPTEAEWEYAARAGDRKIKWAGIDNAAELQQFAWHRLNSDSKTHPVGEKRPNSLGLFDMSGNAHEWCLDRYDEKYYGKSAKSNPLAESKANKVVRRGGSALDAKINLRVSNRSTVKLNEGDDFPTGFRVLCTN